ncbi:DUF805 domain-containing protein [Hymenobacter sp. BT175]|uniref:DUF805 domain-containing protein n=1 Tax=Hymenobacter translucens TaxID=2886507 RepID=UPI001D0E23D1|nr:DUF805 domain-containing protein [Hymenobacter translucens]MCC2547391.1 DUF805 domain-containing protein [Hymenobacter translucens]
MDYFLHALRNYANFNGRARRKEYWMFTLFNIVFSIAVAIADQVLNLGSESFGYGILSIIYSLAMIIPGLAVAVRRLHDVNKSGWFLFIALIPIIGGIWLLILFCTEGTHGSNQYGEDPKQQPDVLAI